MAQSRPHGKTPADAKESLRGLGVVLARRREAILDRWQKDVHERLPKASDLSLVQLRDDLPAVLETIGGVLGNDEAENEQEFDREVPGHGLVRYHQDFTLNELLLEYQVFRQAALAEIIDELGRMLTLEELEEFQGAFDAATRCSAEAFTTIHSDQIRLQSESLGRFLAFLSHDLRNSLNAALLSMEVIALEAQTRARQSSAGQWQEVADELKNASQLIRHTFDSAERILHAELLRQGKVPLEIVDVRVAQLIEGLAKGMNRGEAGPAAKVDLQLEPHLIVHTDRALLETVLQNLIGNAIKHGRGAPIVIRTSTDDDSRCRIEVNDNGPGIPAHVLPKLFKPFERGESTQTGAGLGLSIAAHATRLLQGTLTAESQPGQGSTFRLIIPRRLEPPASTTPHPTTTAQPGADKR